MCSPHVQNLCTKRSQAFRTKIKRCKSGLIQTRPRLWKGSDNFLVSRLPFFSSFRRPWKDFGHNTEPWPQSVGLKKNLHITGNLNDVVELSCWFFLKNLGSNLWNTVPGAQNVQITFLQFNSLKKLALQVHMTCGSSPLPGTPCAWAPHSNGSGKRRSVRSWAWGNLGILLPLRPQFWWAWPIYTNSAQTGS